MILLFLLIVPTTNALLGRPVHRDVLVANEEMHARTCARSERLFYHAAASGGLSNQRDEADAWLRFSFPQRSGRDDGVRIDERPPPPFGAHDLARASTFTLANHAECAAVIGEAESDDAWILPSRLAHYASRAGATRPLAELPKALAWLNAALLPSLLPACRAAFPTALAGADVALRVRDARLVKYDAAVGRTALGVHRDGPLLTAVLALNDEFDGGGTLIEALSGEHGGGGGGGGGGSGGVLRLGRGHVVLHPGLVRHGGAPITRGVRYILVVFLFDASVVNHGHCCLLRANADLAAALRGESAPSADRRRLLARAAHSYCDAIRAGAGDSGEAAHLGLGQALVELGNKHRPAVVALEAALVRAPANAHTHAILARARAAARVA